MLAILIQSADMNMSIKKTLKKQNTVYLIDLCN